MIPARPHQPIDEGIPGPGLLAHMITNRYSHHLPLYGQEYLTDREIFIPAGVVVAPA